MERDAFVFYNPSPAPPPLSPGSVPSLYREVFDAISISNKVPKELWLKAVATGHITETAAGEVSGEIVCTVKWGFENFTLMWWLMLFVAIFHFLFLCDLFLSFLLL